MFFAQDHISLNSYCFIFSQIIFFPGDSERETTMSDILKSILGGADEPGMQVRAIKAGPEIGARMQELHEALDREMTATEVTGEAGGGMVRIRLSVDGTPKGVEVSPELYAAEMREPLEDLILAALQDAHRKSDAESGRIRSAHMEKVGRLMARLVEGAPD
jgi:nucleoid-associated protein EbfC